MLWRKTLAFAVLLILFSGCAMPGEAETAGGAEEEGEPRPPIKQVHKSVAIVDESMQESAEPAGETGETAPEGNETGQEEVPGGNETSVEEEEPAGEGNETGIRLVEFDPPGLLLDCNGECVRHRVYDEENDVVIAAVNKSRLLMAKESEYFMLHSSGCADSGDYRDSFEAGGGEYWFVYPAAFKRDWADFAEFESNETGFSLHEGESINLDGDRVLLWKIVPGASVCDAWVEVSILGETFFLEEWMEGVVLGLDETDGETELEYLMYPEDMLE
ncbi:hypothetical protein GF412_00575 [Candidatus Micrarchaeota archaeon]|nr:hypothetical protein [Candidatus Micrarchaeota archaeon]MBD3417470.1 hypothetical protein [Candidatus Micrarchaeota archaeon]